MRGNLKLASLELAAFTASATSGRTVSPINWIAAMSSASARWKVTYCEPAAAYSRRWATTGIRGAGDPVEVRMLRLLRRKFRGIAGYQDAGVVAACDLSVRPPNGGTVSAQHVELVRHCGRVAKHVTEVGVLGDEPERNPLAVATDQDAAAAASVPAWDRCTHRSPCSTCR